MESFSNRSLVVAVMVLLLSSCRTSNTVNKENVRLDSIVSVRLDTVFIDRLIEKSDSTVHVDSVCVKEKILVEVDSFGNIIRTDRSVEKNTVRVTQQYNSLMMEYKELEREYRSLERAFLDMQSETVSSTETEKQLSWWEKVKINIRKGLAVIVLMLLIAVIMKFNKK